MTGSQLFRIGGLGFFVGAVAFVFRVVLRSVISAGVDPALSAKGGFWVPVNALGALGAALVLLGLPASALWVAVGTLVVVPGGPSSNLAVNLLSNLGPVLLLIGLGYLGFRAWAERAPAKHVGPGADG